MATINSPRSNLVNDIAWVIQQMVKKEDASKENDSKVTTGQGRNLMLLSQLVTSYSQISGDSNSLKDRLSHVLDEKGNELFQRCMLALNNPK